MKKRCGAGADQMRRGRETNKTDMLYKTQLNNRNNYETDVSKHTTKQARLVSLTLHSDFILRPISLDN
jgi:hypothetical protein